MIDYRALLVKYITHVGTCEGTSFIDTLDHSDDFTQEEITELKVLDQESLDYAPL